MLVSNALISGNIRAHYSDNYVPLPGVDHSLGRRVFIQTAKLNQFETLFKKRSTNFNLCYVFKQLALLKGPGFLQSLFHKSSAVSRVLPFEGGQIKYAAFEGSLYVDEIQITGSLGVDSKHPAGVYKVKRSNSNEVDWEPDEKDHVVSQIGYVPTKNLAINGHSASLSDAANFMGKFIEHGFGAASINETYSLFYSPTQSAIGSAYKSLKDNIDIKELESAKKLAAVFEQLSGKNQEVNLTIHGSGHAVFRSALKKIKQQNIQLPNVTVYYANATTNLSTVDYQRRQAGMKLNEKAPLLNPLSLQQNYISGNIFSGPEVAARANPGDTISNGIKAGKALAAMGAVSSFSLGLGAITGLGSFAAGSLSGLQKQVIDSPEKAIQESAKLVWDSVHKMMVRA